MIISISSWKGGTGKTTLGVLAARTLAGRGGRVLIIDLDSNCAISQCFGAAMQDHTSMEFLSGTGEGFLGVYPTKVEGISIIPGDLKNMLLNNVMDTQLKINLRRSGLAEQFDYIIIDPPGYWGAHARNAVFAADVLVIPGTCSQIDLEATKLYFQTLRQCDVPADTWVCVNASNVRSNAPGVLEGYREAFGAYLMPGSVPYIQSMKRLTGDVSYALRADIKARLEVFVDKITGGTSCRN